MEVEAALSAVLRSNGYPERRWSTQDYVKLRDPMHLTDYEFRLTLFPHIRPFAPFSSWSNSQPTQSLSWYHAYNLTKHDRERHFREATLEHAIHAVSAVVALFYAQFGWLKPNADQFHFFSVLKLPTFPLEEYYLWERRDPIRRSIDVVWRPIHFPLPS
jgi:hypothetical protein